LARDEINADGGINGRIIEFIIEDSDNAQKASTAATKLVMQDEVDVLYPITTPVVAAASAVAEQNQVLAFGFTSVQTFAKKNTWVFSDLRSVVQECTMLAATALKNGHTRLAFLGNDADFTVECREALENDFVGKGGAIVADEIKISNDPDARTIIAKIKQANPDALLLLCWPPDCNIIYKQMLELDFAPQFYLPVGIPLPANPASLKGIDKERILKDAYAGDQAINPENPTPELAAFIEKYEARLTKEPEHIADPAVVYDNMHEIAIAARKCEPLTNECLREKLSETDYVGAAGKVAFEGKHYTARPSRVVQYKDGKWVEP
jgi:ABC-type branched-subunit amino acid transport system substrate-binding protein